MQPTSSLRHFSPYSECVNYPRVKCSCIDDLLFFKSARQLFQVIRKPKNLRIVLGYRQPLSIVLFLQKVAKVLISLCHTFNTSSSINICLPLTWDKKTHT